MSDQSTGKSRADVCQYAGDEHLLGRSTIIDIVHQEGEQLIVAQHARARAILDGASEAQLALLGPAAADPDARTGLVDDDPPFDDSEEAQAEWEQTQAEWIATGFPGCEPAFPVAKDEPRAVDEGFVIVEPDEVKTKAQPSTGRKEVWTYTAVVLVDGLRYAFADLGVEGLWLQVSALLLELGVLSSERRLLVLVSLATSNARNSEPRIMLGSDTAQRSEVARCVDDDPDRSPSPRLTWRHSSRSPAASPCPGIRSGVLGSCSPTPEA
jgi:hypothetical protein